MSDKESIAIIEEVTEEELDAALGGLSEELKAAMRLKVGKALKLLKRSQKPFSKSVNWVLLIFSFSILTTSSFMPKVSFGATFNGIATFVMDKEQTAQIPEMEDDEDLNTLPPI